MSSNHHIPCDSFRLLQILRAALFSLLSCLAVSNSFATQEKSAAKSLQSLSFEEESPGTIDELDSQIGRWKRIAGAASIDDKHSKTGQNCLHLAGGQSTVVVLDLASHIDTTGQLVFWAERWTRRSPFSFRIEKDSGSGWEPLYQGDSDIIVGRAFLKQVKVDLLDANIRKLRFSVTSPANTGILIDDLRFASLQPQRILSVTAEPFTAPALVGVQYNPLLKLKVVTEGTQKPISLKELIVSVHTKNNVAARDIKSGFIFYRANNEKFDSNMQVEVKFRPQEWGWQRIIADQQLAEGDNYIWLASTLNDQPDIDHSINAICKHIQFSNGQHFEINARSTQRMGVALRNAGDDGVHTYRIPGLATTNQGTLIGVYDVRRRSGRDLPGDIDVGMSRSTDGGRTWEPMKIIMDMGNSPAWQYDGIGDPAVLVDQRKGTIWVAATWSHGNRSWNGSGPGMTPEETGQLMLVRSDDDGVTWSKPINITEQVKRPEWSFILQGPGKGITMRDGTLVFAAQYQAPPNLNDKSLHRIPSSTIIYSKDHGKTWHVGTAAHDDTTEAQVVEVEPGVLMLNCRYNRANTRVVMTTSNLGKDWIEHPTSKRSLFEPRACMGSIIDVDQEAQAKLGGWLLFSNPNSTRGRQKISIKASPDKGLTWPKQHRLLLDGEPSAGYSCMSMIDDKTIGILYEGSQSHMTFQRIPLDTLTSKTDVSRLGPKKPEDGLRLARPFSDHMILQANAPIPIWGRARPSSLVSVSFGESQTRTHADPEGHWIVNLPPEEVTKQPRILRASTQSEEVLVEDILVGEVWLCAGQSNMEWPLEKSMGAADELEFESLPNLRLLHMTAAARGNAVSYTTEQLALLHPDAFMNGRWETATPVSAGKFSAVSWYFGKMLQQELDVPVGLICPAVGGTPIESWIPSTALKASSIAEGMMVGDWLENHRLSEFCRSRAALNFLESVQSGETLLGDRYGPNHAFKPGFMWESAVKTLIPFAIRGVIWYQGESNAETASRADEYDSLQSLLVREWRSKWKQGAFPFLYVQLPALNRPFWPHFRERQRQFLNELPNVGMAITIDTGHPTDVHPTQKKPVGERLARLALGSTYRSKRHTVFCGPLPVSLDRRDDSIEISFEQVGQGLVSSDQQSLRHFELCGPDGIYYPATATVTSKRTVLVSSTQVPQPSDARYAWSPYPTPVPNLVNSAGLPATPFSTENALESLNAFSEN